METSNYETFINVDEPRHEQEEPTEVISRKKAYRFQQHKKKDSIMMKHLSKAGVVYLNKDDQKTMIRYDEVHKFSYGTLNKVCEKLKVMIRDNVLGYANDGIQGRKWTTKDKERSKKMIHKIEKTLKKGRQLRRLESYVGGRLKENNIRVIDCKA
nr:hypothetical protein [Tanacetum cinerariifolium]